MHFSWRFCWALSAPLYADPHSDAKAEVAFGIDVAHKGLWREAVLRWQKAIALDKTYAEAWNDLAIGYEQMGNFPWGPARPTIPPSRSNRTTNTSGRTTMPSVKSMTGRTAAAVASGVLAVSAAACLSISDIQIETPIQAKIDVSAFQRVLVVGFITGGSKAVDANTETVRLLKSQLRTKSDLKVVDTGPAADYR